MMGAETAEHKLLKELAIIWLRGYGCHQIATEVSVHNSDSRRHVADVVGIRDKWLPYNRGISAPPLAEQAKDRRFSEAVCVEVKVSRSDFMNGFVSGGCDRIYLWTLPGIVDPKELPNQIGLIEVDPTNYEVLGWGKRIPPTPTVHGIVVRKKAKRVPLEKDDVERIRQYILELRATPSLIAVLLNKYAPNNKQESSSVAWKVPSAGAVALSRTST